MTYRFDFFVGNIPNFRKYDKKLCTVVEFKIHRKKVCCSLQKIVLDNCAIMNDTCMKKIKIGHQAKFRDKGNFFPQVLFPVCMILRRIFTSAMLCMLV